MKGNIADVFIQWKGTDICLDFHCHCQPAEDAYEGHYDGFFAYSLECSHCGEVYQMPTGFQLSSFKHDPVVPDDSGFSENQQAT